MKRSAILALILVGTATAGETQVTSAFADDRAPLEDQTAASPAAGPLPPVLQPAMLGPILANPAPMSVDLGPVLGKTYVGGVVSGMGLFQDHPLPGDKKSRFDIANGAVFIQKVDGIFQYFIQAGISSYPALGAPYLTAATQEELLGPLPMAYLKIAPSETFSILAGQLPPLVGAEYGYTFENMNIERGLLWYQEPGINRGVLVNYTHGPVTISLSWNDGFYSDRWSWLSGAVTWIVDPANTVLLIGAANTKKTTISTAATPALLNNEQVYNLIYTYSAGPWTVTPYLQYTYVPPLPKLGTFAGASTYGGAVLVKYSFDGGFSLPVRAEYLATTGNAAAGAPNLLYGVGSDAWSITLTPTFQYGIFFARVEGSYVRAANATASAGFGPLGNATSQARFVVETGILF